MKNVETKIDGKKLVITVDLEKEIGPSGSGKTIIIGTSAGNVEVRPGVFMGLNVYRKR